LISDPEERVHNPGFGGSGDEAIRVGGVINGKTARNESSINL